MKRYRVTVCRDTCIACTNCYSLYPQIFESDSKRKSRIVKVLKTETKNYLSIGEIDDSIYNYLRKMNPPCPFKAIKVEE